MESKKKPEIFLNKISNTLSIIDANSHKLPEYDYMRICNNLQDLYKTIFEKRNDENNPYTNDSYYELESELHLIQERMNVSLERIRRLKVKKNMSKDMKVKALHKYAERNNIDIKKNEITNVNLKNMIPKLKLRDMKDIFNDFLENYNLKISKARQVLTVQLDEIRSKRDAVIVQMYEYIF